MSELELKKEELKSVFKHTNKIVLVLSIILFPIILPIIVGSWLINKLIKVFKK